MISTLEKLSRTVWAYHYRIRELAYWGVLLAAATVALALPVSSQILIGVVFVIALALTGIVRWKFAKRRCRFSLIVPLFQEGAGAVGRAAEAQTLIVDHLRRHLPYPVRGLIQPLAVEVGPADDALAANLQRQLRSLYVLHGRIATHGDSWSIYPRVLESANEKVTHLDRFTHDRTPSNPRFGPFVSSLQPSIGVRDEEFPLDFCRDLEAVVGGLLGMALVAFQQHEAALEHLDKALEKAPDSLNHQIDALRVARGRALTELGRRDEAIDFLRARCRRPDPSPDLLRWLAHLLQNRVWAGASTKEADEEEARSKLREALANDLDPQRDMTAYNLVMMLPDWDDEGEGGKLLSQLLRPGSSYRHLWYVRKLVADRAWHRLEEARRAEDDEAAQHEASIAAKWYSKTLKARPRIQYLGLAPKWPFLRLKRFPLSPILYANAKDGHEAAGHHWRTWYLEKRFQWIRKKMLKRADRHLRNAEWDLAYAHFDWVAIVGRHDLPEHVALALASCCCWKGGRKKDGEEMWKKAAQHDPACLAARAVLFQRLSDLGLDSSLPGHEPTDLEEVAALIRTRFPDMDAVEW